VHVTRFLRDSPRFRIELHVRIELLKKLLNRAKFRASREKAAGKSRKPNRNVQIALLAAEPLSR
jgi:hypothetical protein